MSAALAVDDSQSGTRTPRPHQVEVLDLVKTSLTTGPRAQIIMACGTGKTLIGRWHAEQTAAAVTVVVLPSLSLVAQTLEEWRSVPGWPFEALITCSDRTTAYGERERVAGDGQDVNEAYWAGLKARVTTDAVAVAGRLKGHSSRWPLVVFSTYHSVHVVADAARRAGITIDLVIADEAHNLAGHPRSEFRTVLDAKLPARSRLFATATQVVIGSGYPAEFDDWSAPTSMADEKLFGPVAYRLDFAEAIERDLLSDYRVCVYETEGANLTPDPVAALVSGATHGVSKVLSFHGRVAKAKAFAAAIDGITLPDGRTVLARSVAGVDPTSQRKQALSLLGEARPDQLVVVSSARCLSAGIDIPAVDGVLFADPKNSDVDVVQAVGRALRKAPGKSHGTVMIPVCVPEGLDDDTALSTGAFAPVWRVLRGLRSMDSRLAAELEAFTRPPSRRGVPDASRSLSRIEFNVRSITNLNARIIDFLNPAWDRFYSELEQFVADHGHAKPPLRSRLGEWCERQRIAFRRGMLDAEHAALLRVLPGWTWNLEEQRWLEQWTQVVDLYNRYGKRVITDPDLAAIRLQNPDPKSRVSTVGRWCASNRQLMRCDDLDEWRRDKLTQISGLIRGALAADDAAAVDLLREYVAWKGTANAPADVVEDDIPLGRWLNDIRRRRVTETLTQALLDEIEVVCPSYGLGKLNWYCDEMLWLLGMEALRQFVAREGHARIPDGHQEQLRDIVIALCDWARRQRYLYRHDRLIPARALLLAKISGWQWEIAAAPRIQRDIGASSHGTRTGYVKGCRCEDCTRANRAQQLEYARRLAAGEPTTTRLDPGRTREHLKRLIAKGATQQEIGRASGMQRGAISRILSGKAKYVIADTEKRLCALTLEDTKAAAGAATLVDAAATWRLLDDMIARGWPKTWISKELGSNSAHAALQLRRDVITARNAAKVEELARRLGDRRPPKCSGGIPPLAQIIAETDQTSAA